MATKGKDIGKLTYHEKMTNLLVTSVALKIGDENSAKRIFWSKLDHIFDSNIFFIFAKKNNSKNVKKK
jgi:hypothetical protein